MKLFLIASVGALTLLGAGCAQQPVEQKAVAPLPPITDQTTTTKPTPLVTTPTSTAMMPGQKVGDFVLVGIDPSNIATFTGTSQVSGTYAPSELDGNLCFYPDSESYDKLPHLNHRIDQQGMILQDTTFCFSNQDEAKKLFGPRTGQATINIKGFSGRVIDSSVPPTSELVSVVTMTPSK